MGVWWTGAPIHSSFPLIPYYIFRKQQSSGQILDQIREKRNQFFSKDAKKDLISQEHHKKRALTPRLGKIDSVFSLFLRFSMCFWWKIQWKYFLKSTFIEFFIKNTSKIAKISWKPNQFFQGAVSKRVSCDVLVISSPF